MTKPPTKTEFKAALGSTLDVDVARFFDISAAAVSQWSDDQPIPKTRWLEAQLRRPDLFAVAAEQG